MRQQIKTIAELVMPGVLHNRRIRKATDKEREIELLPFLCKSDQIAVDIGANQGLYVHHLLKFVKAVWAFEPIPSMQKKLLRFYGDRIRLEPIALSDSAGRARLRMPVGNTSWATLSDSNKLELADSAKGFAEFEVETRPLDSYNLQKVGFVKIDVEGHEEAVLMGAIETIRREKPSIVVEVEERHNIGSVRRVEALLGGLGYSGFFFLDAKLKPMTSFDEARDQKIENVTTGGKSGRYINNSFMWTRRSSTGSSAFCDALTDRALLFCHRRHAPAVIVRAPVQVGAAFRLPGIYYKSRSNFTLRCKLGDCKQFLTI